MNFFQSLPRLALLLVALAGLLAGGCANKAVIFATTTRTAVEISAAEGGQQGVHVGFDRFEGVMMPLVHTNRGGQSVTLTQAYPVYAEYEYATGGLTPASAANGSALVLRQVFATGRAATNVAVQRQVSADFVRLQGYSAKLGDQTAIYASITNRFASLSPEGKLAVRNKAASLGLIEADGTSDLNFAQRLRRAVDPANGTVAQKLAELDQFAAGQ